MAGIDYSKYTKEVAEVKKELQTEIDEKSNKLNMIENIEKYIEGGITYDDYVALSTTNMRYTKLLGKLVEVSLPFLKLKGVMPNSYVYEIEGGGKGKGSITEEQGQHEYRSEEVL